MDKIYSIVAQKSTEIFVLFFFIFEAEKTHFGRASTNNKTRKNPSPNQILKVEDLDLEMEDPEPEMEDTAQTSTSPPTRADS